MVFTLVPLSLLIGASPGGGLDIDAAVEAALARAPALKAAAAQEAKAAAQAEVARSAYLPRVDFDAAYLARSPKNALPIELPPIPGLEPIGDVDDVHHVQVGLSAGMRVFDLSRGYRVDAADAALDAEKAQTLARTADLAYAVRATFLAALYAREVRDVAAASLKVAQEDQKRVELRVQAGVASEVALAQARVRAASLDAQRRRAESELSRARARLSSLLAQDPLPPLEGDLEALGASGVGEAAELSGHPELRRLAALEAASTAMAKGRSRTLVPTLSVMGSATLMYPRNLVLEFGPVYQAGVSLAWPIFDGFAREREVDLHEAQAAALARLSEAKREELSRALIDVRAQERTAEAELESAETTLDQTQVYLRVAKAALQSGAGTELDVHTAELGLDQAKMAKKKALFDRARLHAEALRILGRVAEGSAARGES